MASRRERKVVTVLFADLVGFTARAETLDPEDVEAILRPYHDRLRSELERFGGTVEKFIGDAVMALFGAPVAHEDDPERAVRAALAIRDWAREDENVQVRIAVNTGEALVNLAARPESGEGMAAGDVVNTAARLQAAGPVNGVLVSETTYRATEGVVIYRAAEPVEAKGKSDPLRVWEAVEARAHAKAETTGTRVPLVGRERELNQLADSLNRVSEDRSPQLVTIVGVPGIGKSRLVAELYARADASPELIWWRHGRSLPYGEGVAFWAVAEMVKAQAGILENDSAEVAAAKLHAAVADVISGADREWVETRLRPLLGLGGPADLAGDRRSESFTAWRRFFESLAEQRPLVLAFEDLHWADDDLLDFVDELVDWVEGVPLLTLCTARPELFTRRPGWGGGKRNAVTISLAALNDSDTAKFVSQLLERSVLPAETQSELLARAGGNPLYAEQFVRMLSERGTATELPETVQGIIAARLDGLSREEKELLQDASVLGKVFWPGALESINDDDGELVDTRLHDLARREFVRRGRRSSVAGQTEYEFGHVLIRDVAYAQIPRADRALKHRAAAAWIESLSQEHRFDDRADILAHHYLAALELSKSAGLDVGDLAEPARRALWDAGDRAFAIGSFGAALRAYSAAFDLWPEDDERWPLLVVKREHARQVGGEAADERVLVRARERLIASGEFETAATADLVLARSAWWRGRGGDAADYCDRALEALANVEISPIKVDALAERARLHMVAGQRDRARELAPVALELAERLGDERAQANILITLGTAANDAGALERGIELALDTNDAAGIQRGYNNLAELRWTAMSPDELVGLYVETRRHAERFANRRALLWGHAQESVARLYLGDWDAAERLAETYLEMLGSDHDYLEAQNCWARAHIAMGRGSYDEGMRLSAQAEELGREAGDAQAVGPSLARHAVYLALDGRIEEAAERVREVVGLGWLYYVWVWDLALASVLVGETNGVSALLAADETPWRPVGQAIIESRFADAAGAATAFPTIAAFIRLVGAHALCSCGRRAEAQPLLLDAARFYEAVRARGFLARAESLLAATA